MRRQYYSRVVDGHRQIWDVHRLVEATRDHRVVEVQLSTIRELDEPFWFDGTEPTCREVAIHAQLIAETDLGYPIILSADGYVMDGMHRVCKALIEGRTAIRAVQLAKDPPPDYVDYDLDALPYDEP